MGAFCILTTAKPQPDGWMYESGQRLQVTALSEKAVVSQVSCRRKSMQGLCWTGYEKVAGLFPERQGRKQIVAECIVSVLAKVCCLVFCKYRTLQFTATTAKKLVTK